VVLLTPRESVLAATVWETRYFRRLGEPDISRVEVGSAPRWLTRYGIPIIEERPNASTPFQVVNFDIYHPECHRRDLKLVAEFGRSGIPQMKELDQCYLHLRSASRGEEGSGPALDEPNRRLYEERLRAWAAAFQGAAYKLCNVSGKEEDIALCNQLGMGQRNGFAWFPGRGYTGSDLQIQATRGDAVIRLVRVIKLH
jgi:hypothetical protein